MQSNKLIHVITNIRVLLATVFLLLCMLIGLLFCEYRFFCVEAQKMLALQAQYRSYVRYMQKKKQNSSLESQEQSERSGQAGFVVVNRDPSYLKDSMIDYLKDRKLDGELERLNVDEWQDYTEQTISGRSTSARAPTRASRAGNKKNKKRAAKQAASKKKRAVKKKRHVNQAPVVAHSGSSLFIWPIEGDNFWLSSLFGPRKKANGSWGRHTGIDMAAVKGTRVKAAADGVVIEAGFVKGYGNTIVLRHGSRYKTRYAHLHKIFVSVGQEVSCGKVIGSVGDTGFIRKKGKDGSHLHFEVYSYNKHINPLTVLPLLN